MLEFLEFVLFCCVTVAAIVGLANFVLYIILYPFAVAADRKYKKERRAEQQAYLESLGV